MLKRRGGGYVRCAKWKWNTNLTQKSFKLSGCRRILEPQISTINLFTFFSFLFPHTHTSITSETKKEVKIQKAHLPRFWFGHVCIQAFNLPLMQ
jgi:hypothetical protein